MDDKNRKKIARFGMSTLGLLVVFIFIIALNVLFDGFHLRWDVTEGNIYTLSDSTKNILASMDDKINIRFYYSRDLEGVPAPLKTYASQVEDMLREYEMAADGRITIEKLNPIPDSDAEDAALMDGVQRQNVGVAGSFYLGLAITRLDETIALPAISPARAGLFEFDVTRAIHRVLNPAKKSVGILASLPVDGAPVNPMNPQMQNQSQGPWYFMRNLRKDYNVRKLDWSLKKIPADLDVLVVIHPKSPGADLQFAIDQYLLAGGRVVMCLDPFSLFEQMQNRYPGAPSASADMTTLLDAWGVEFDPSKILVDAEYKSRMNDGASGVREIPTMLTLDRSAMNEQDVTTSQLDALLIPYAGAFRSDSNDDDIDRTVLLQSSTKSRLAEAFEVNMPGSELLKNRDYLNERLPLALKLTGKFKTAFPAGPPADQDEPDEAKKQNDAVEDDAAKTQDTEKTVNLDDTIAKSATAFIKQAERPGTVVLIADSDFLYDAVCVQQSNIFGQQVLSMISDNLYLFENIVEQLAGGSELIGLRSRETGHRPFKVLEEKREQAAAQYASRIEELENILRQTQSKLRQLQARKTEEQRLTLSPEQEQLIRNAQRKEIEIRQQLKQLRRDTRKAERRLEARLEFVNIVLVPILVTIVGIIVGITRIRRSSAS